MRLVPCTPPSEPLDSAPRTALFGELDAAHWEGFWSRSSDAYYARCTTGDGRTEWYRMDDDASVRDGERSAVGPAHPRVLTFRGDAMRRVALVVASSPGGRQMLVGSSKRIARQ